MIWEDLRGHREQLEMFRRAVQRNRTAHACLFVGPKGVGKNLVARRISQCLFCPNVPDEELDACGTCSSCKQVQAGVHPDLLMVGLPEGKKELPIALFVGEDEKRGREGLCRELSLRPMSAPRRIAIIDDADRMNEESANALLKTLEEPPEGSILFLIASSTDALLPTIRSRVQPLHFSALTQEDIADLATSLGWEADPAAAAEVARMSDGSMDLARRLLEPGLRALRDDLHEAMAIEPFNAIETSKRLIKSIEDLGGGTAGQRDHATWLIRFAVDFFRQALVSGDSGKSHNRFLWRYSSDDPLMADRLAEVLDRTLESEQRLQQSMPVPLCLEALFHDIGRVLRGVVVA
jgi:DNA polymerase-3 subunit delta'